MVPQKIKFEVTLNRIHTSLEGAKHAVTIVISSQPFDTLSS